MTIHHGDCVEVMAAMPADSIDAIVCDPPYELSFMGKDWDRDANHAAWTQAALRVAKPGAYLLAFGGTRTVHRMTVALEDAGWIIRDMLVWAYASGFPKSKALLKPAWEPIVMARKPGPLRDLDIEGCRIEGDASVARVRHNGAGTGDIEQWRTGARSSDTGGASGRWPANVVLTDPVFDGGWDGVVGGGETGKMPGDYKRQPVNRGSVRIYGGGDGIPDLEAATGYGDTVTYSRFFLVPKASRSDREPVMPGMLEERVEPKIARRGKCVECGRWMNAGEASCPCGGEYEYESNGPRHRRNVHPTVKPIELMRHLVRLVTPAGGTVLDPFLGSGTTALAAEQEGRDWVGIEREAEYVRIAEARLSGWQRGMGLEVAV
jgi:DNA modification methylase